uniref:G-protein coupled receptors family 1 profile domain-containing protein n=1 Tax=Leptobrachium leishanense TaxID=445787 RepID=A0A8C5M7S9_9ANUR
MEDAVTTAVQLQSIYQKMHGDNHSLVTEVQILGFPSLNAFKIPVFIIIILIYSLTISENVLIIVLVSMSHHLHSPMYFFLANLSVTDIILVTNVIPKTLCIIIREGDTLTILGCLTQFFLHGVSVSTECFLLTVMSGDRYLAICKPLHYVILMSNPMLCIRLVSLSWLLSFCAVLIYIISMTFLQFCGPNVIDHFFCDLMPLFELSCSDITFFQLEMLFLSVPFTLFPLLIITVSYASIVRAVLRISTDTGRGKAFSTCSSHLAVVSIFYGTLFGSYVIPSKGNSLTAGKSVSLLYTVFTPLINPIIYSLKNKDINRAMRKRFCKSNE